MKKPLLALLAVAPLCLASPLSQAQDGGLETILEAGTSSAASDDRSRFAVGIELGTRGVSLEVAVPLFDTLNVRASYNALSYDTDFEDTEVNYTADFKKNSVGVMLDWHPWAGGLRLSAGIFSHFDNDIKVVSTPSVTGSYTINDTVYNSNDIGEITGNIGFKKTTPYLGIGWGNAARAQGFTMMFDLGVQFQSTPSIDLSATNCNLGAVCAQLEADIEAEIAELRQDADDFDLWPVLNVGFMYRF